MTWQRELAKIVYPNVFDELDKARIERDSHIVTIKNLRDDIVKSSYITQDLIKENNDFRLTILDLKEEKLTNLEKYCSDIYEETSKFAYKDKGLYNGNRFDVYPNELIQPDLFLIQKIRRSLRLNNFKDMYSKAKVVGNYVDKRLKWTSDEDTDKTIDAYQTIYDVLFNNKQDCENHAGLVSSIEPEIGIAFGFCGTTGHAFNVFVYQNELYVLETNRVYDKGNSFKILKYKDQTSYDIHWIFTKDKTFKCKDKVTSFGVKVY